MADEGWDLNTRMLTDAPHAEDLMASLFQYFKAHKVEISYAIKKTFPFLEGLRDRELITNKMYKAYQDSCRESLVPVHRVMYSVLNDLEKIFDMAVLEALFSEVNREVYPALMNIYKDFQNVIHDKLCFQESDEEREERPDTQLRLEEGTRRNSVPRSLTWLCSEPSPSGGTTLSENGLPHQAHQRKQIKGLKTETNRQRNDAPGNHQTDEQTAHESAPVEPVEEVTAQEDNGDTGVGPSSPSPCAEEGTELHSQGIQVGSCSVLLVDIKKEKPFFSEDEQRAQRRAKCEQATDVIVISSDDSEELSDGEETLKACTSALSRKPVISDHDPLEASEEEETQEATCSRQSTPNPMDFKTFRKSPLKRGREHDYNSSESSEEETLPQIDFCSLRCRSRLSTTEPENTGKPSVSGTHNWKRWVSSGGSPKLNHREEHLETLRSGSGAELQGPGNKCPCVMCSSECVPGGQEEKIENGQASYTMDAVAVGNNSTLGKDIGKRRKKERRTHKIKPLQKGRERGRSRILSTLSNGAPRKRGWPKGRKRVNTKLLKRVRKRGPRIPKETNVNFNIPELPVTCGNAKGTLYKEIFKQGVWKDSIKGENGSWFSPREFEIKGNHAASKNWKLSVRCHGWTLRELIERGYLPEPPSKRKKKATIRVGASISRTQRTLDSYINAPEDPYPQNSNECEVCAQGGQMYCCDTCPKSYHENCHIPPVETESNPWSCIFCKTKAIRKRCRESQPCHQESEVLMKELCGEEQLKCELLLLKVYCCVDSAFFVTEPNYGCTCLDQIKTRLNEKKYSRVKEFVQDIRFIFQNYKAFYGDKQFIDVGTLEGRFEKNFKNIFGVQKTTPIICFPPTQDPSAASDTVF
ncbi:nuclear autoantigen Sp-100 isoform X4 [Fukomys damarensis]|uniref:nuclear autoantigen Sp-100 isoform X4 n=1 Tax=Fukomys damarensis TaxID=885580 RepID=UPI00053FBA6C|nr:nuclear autoantigen Sp-100 isoform X4 [Fukomys damarensis]